MILHRRLSYYGIPGLNLGVSLYSGESETVLYNGLDLNNETAVSTADSSKIGIQMIGLDVDIMMDHYSLVPNILLRS